MFDVVIVGGGLGGTLAAAVLHARGCSVAVIDRHAVYPPDFRAEQLVGSQTESLRRLGLLESVVSPLLPVRCAVALHRGELVDRVDEPHYGLPYEAMVNAARAHLPAGVRWIAGSAAGLETSPDLQRVVLASGEAVAGRLVVIATGLGNAFCRNAGFRRTMIADGHSMAFGFGLEPGGRAVLDHVLTHYGEDPRSGLDYFTVFPADRGGWRANVFAYWSAKDARARAFQRAPAESLHHLMPALQRHLGDFRVPGPVQVRVIDLQRAEGVVRDGAVLIGDAFQTSSPAVGSGITRVLNDFERLCCEHVPRWLATPGMGAEKIAAFYDDPVKLAVDAEAFRAAAYRRALSTEDTWSWRLHRERVFATRRLRAWLAGWRPARPPASRGGSDAGAFPHDPAAAIS